MKQIILLSSVILLSFSLYAQDNSYIKGNVSQILSGNEFVILDSSQNEITITLIDTKTVEVSEVSKKVIEYLNDRILNKEIYFSIERVDDTKILGSLLYNCEAMDNMTFEENEIPCTSGKVLNIELIKLRYLKYIGSNDFLKKISEGEDPW